MGQSMSRFAIASPLAGGALHALGSGLFHTLLPLRLIATGHTANDVGLVVAAESAGFLIGCIFAGNLIRSVGEVRAYAAFAALSAVAMLAFGFTNQIPLLMVIQVVVGFVNAGQSVVIESWLNAMASNTGRGRILTLYVLVLGLFYGLGQLMAQPFDPAGDRLLMVSAGFYALALVPVTAIWVGEPELHAPVGLHLLKAFRTSPLGTSASLLTGLISATFASIGPLWGKELGFGQDKIVYLMASVQLGALFLQFPLGALSDRLDRRLMMIWLSGALALISLAFVFVTSGTPVWLLIVMFSIFGGISEIFYPLGVAHANDRAAPEDYVSLSSNLLLVWALGGTIGPATAALGVEHFGAVSFFWYAIALCLAFGGVAIFRMVTRPRQKAREKFVPYAHSSPEIYELKAKAEAGKER